MVTLGLVEDGEDKKETWWCPGRIYERYLLCDWLTSSFKSAANSIDRYGIPRQKFRTICIARFWIASRCWVWDFVRA